MVNAIACIVTVAAVLANIGALKWLLDAYGFAVMVSVASIQIIAFLAIAVALDKRRLRLPYRKLWRYYRQEGRSAP